MSLHPDLIAVAHEGLLLGPSPMVRHTAGAKRETVEGVTLTYFGPFGPALNKVAVVGSAPPLARIRELAATFFPAEAGGYGVVVEADAGHPVEDELRGAGWTVFEDEPALVMPTLLPPPCPGDVEIRRVVDVAGRRDLTKVLAAGFGAPTAENQPELSEDAFEAFTPTLACANDPGIALLVGYIDGVPAASAYLFVVGDIAGVTGVATVPAYRRRGLGTALTWAAVGEGASRGCTRATLAAQGASFDLYRKMGFVHVCNHRAYEPPAA